MNSANFAFWGFCEVAPRIHRGFTADSPGLVIMLANKPQRKEVGNEAHAIGFGTGGYTGGGYGYAGFR
jgi:hypothetical protein